MKVVLLTLLMLTAAVHAAPKHARLSCTSTATQKRRHAMIKGEKYLEGLRTGDPLPGRLRGNNLFPSKRGPRRRKAPRYRKPGFVRKLHPQPVLNFRSPEQLQEYLFSEAENAKHILRSGAAFYSPSNQLERGGGYFPRSSRGSETNLYRNNTVREHRHRQDVLSRAARRHRIHEEDRNEEYTEPKRRNYFGRRPIFVHPYDIPYLYPPPWYVPGLYPYDRKLYETPPPQTTPKPTHTLGDDLVKLKEMVDELDALSEDTQNGGTNNGKSDTEKERNETMADMKEKIDKVIIPILNKISRDLNGTAEAASPPPPPAPTKKPSEGETKKSKEVDTKERHMKNNFPCRIDGSWVCTADALHLNISTMPNMTLKVTVVSENPKKSGYITKDWAINGITLATTGGPFLLAAICPEKRKVANFIGQCRSCREEDIISGLWTFSTAGKDCTEIFTSFETKIDVFRREKSQQVKAEKTSKSVAET